MQQVEWFVEEIRIWVGQVQNPLSGVGTSFKKESEVSLIRFRMLSRPFDIQGDDGVYAVLLY